MSEECFLNGLQCPGQNVIARQLMRAQIIRTGACRLALGDMALAEEIAESEDLSKDTQLREQLAELLARKEAVFADIDAAEVLLRDTGSDLTESCSEREPFITTEPEPAGRRVLHCASTRAAELVPRHATMVLKENK